MEIGEIISNAIKYPSAAWTKVLILGVILIIPIVNFIGVGYLFRIIKATFAGIDELPDFDEVGELFIDGLKIFVVGIVYAIPVYIIAAIVGFLLSISPAATTGTFTGFDIFTFAVGYSVYIIIAIIIGLIEYMAIANMALYEGELGAAFKFSEVLDRIAMIGWGKYLGWYIIMVLLGLVAAVIAGLTIIVIVGFILVPLIILPYFSMFGARSLALLFASSEEGEPAPTPEEPAPAE
jgi:hypothetical protein